MGRRGIAFGAALLVTLGLALQAHATAQWSRKYQVSCTTCHTAFPRLNYYGERFMRNGYQIPDSQDGDTEKKTKVSDVLFVDEVENYLGVRINWQPLEVATHSRRENGKMETAFSVGNPVWLQLFTAGSIYKDASVFIETEFSTTGAFHNNWFRLGLHNLGGRQDAANLHVGLLSPLEWHAVTGRLPQNPAIRVHTVAGVRAANGAGEDAVPVASAQPGVSFYGSQGPVLYNVGIVNGARTSDANLDKNVFGTLRFESRAGTFEGSSVSLWGYRGVNTDSTATRQRDDVFFRLSPAANLRYEKLDLQVGFFYGEDDNFNLAFQEANRIKNIFRGGVVQAGYFMTPRMFGFVQYDMVEDDLDAFKFNKVSPALWFFPRENFRVGVTGRIDLRQEFNATDPEVLSGREKAYEKIHEVLLTIRTMI